MKNKRIDFALLILRLGFGITLAYVHGYSKITGGPDKWEKLGSAMANLGITFFPVFWGFMAAFAEFAGALLVAMGFLTRAAAFLVAFTMAVAVFDHIHGGDKLADAADAFQLLVVFTAILIAGAGQYSIDNSVKVSRFLQ